MQKIKLLDRYEMFEESMREEEEGVWMISARHNIEDKMYTLKKINLDE